MMDIFRDTKNFRFTILLHLFVSYLCNNPTNSGAVSLTSDPSDNSNNRLNIDSVLASNELVFINFYADWCRFSKMLAPIFDEAADKVAQEFPTPGLVVMGKVDCDQQTEIAGRFHITKYPTLKVIRNGQPAKREYRGQRSVTAFLEFIKKQLEDPIQEFFDLSQLKNLDSKKRIIIGFFDRKDVPEYQTFRRVASNLKDDCQFHVGFGNFVKSELEELGGVAKLVYLPDDMSDSSDKEIYKGNVLNFTELLLWGNKVCIPLVREINFENAEEITEEGLPLMILFYKPGDEEYIRKYKIACQQLKAERSRINFVYAEGDMFSHPIAHLGLSLSDLPIVAIDSFRHMYLLPDMRQLGNPDALERFIEDLYSGKLHREYHYGPEAAKENKSEVNNNKKEATTTDASTTKEPNISDPAKSIELSNPKNAESIKPQSTEPSKPQSTEPSKPKATSIPDSAFKKLQPSHHRYTLLRDEL